MSGFLGGIAYFIAFLIAVNFYRVIRGPSIYDRLLGIGAIGTNAVLLLALLGFVYERPDAFMDLAITYAILNFIGVVAVAKYLDEEVPLGRRAPAGAEGDAKGGAPEPAASEGAE